MSKDKSFVQNTMILFAAMLVSKILGAVFKIPLTNILGGTGMGYYSAAYSLFTPIFAITAAGIPTVMVKTTARLVGGKAYGEARRMLSIALKTFGAVGAVGSLIMILLAVPFSDFISGSPESLYAMLAISPSVFICCIGSVYRGYYEGLNDMAPTALSVVIEAAVRTAVGLAAAFGVTAYAAECFNSGMPFFSVIYQTAEQSAAAALPFAAAAATAAVTLSELAGTAFLKIKYSFGKKTDTPDNAVTVKYKSSMSVAKRLIKDCIPIAIGSVVINLSSVIDLVTITRCIDYSVSNASEYFNSNFGSIIALHGGTVSLGNFMYGSYTGIAMTMVMLIPAFTGMLSKSALPQIAAAWAVGDFARFKSKVSLVIRSNILIGVPLYLGLAVLSEPVLRLLYSSRPDEVALSVIPMAVLSIGGIFTTLTSSFFAIFQVIGREDLPIRLMLFASAVKLVLNVFLITMPQINIIGAALSSTVSYAAAAAGSWLALENHCKMDLKLIKMSIPIFIAGICCAASAYFCCNYCLERFSSLISIAISVAVSAIIYIILLIFSGNLKLKSLLNRQNLKKS